MTRWSDGISYTLYSPANKLVVSIPNSATSKEVTFTDSEQVDLVTCLIDEVYRKRNPLKILSRAANRSVR